MSGDAFVVLAEPTRRRILDELRRSDNSVGGLVEVLGVRQPTMSKHLKVLREAGFVSCRVAAQQRIYRIEARQLQSVWAWLAPYRMLWNHYLAALERHLDTLDTAGSGVDDVPDAEAVGGDRREM